LSLGRKSNCRCTDYVSPAGFGKETTRRPSLVISSKESAIDQYFSTDAEINHLLSQFRINKHALATPGKEDGVSKVPKVREAFDSVADYLRGIRTKEEFKGQIRVNTLPLTPSNLEETLTQDLTTEPLLTVIRCKGGHLLSHGVAVVDTPGLDGSRSNWRDDPIHEWVIKRAEFFIFVQSSVAAWNGETRDFVEEVLAQSTKPPIWLVQNIFEARHWQPTDKQRQAEADQREEGKKRIVELLGAAPRSVLGLNIGLAWDGKNELNNEWLQRSKFLKFEEDLAQILHAERASIQERNSIENLRQQLSKSKDRLYEAAQNLQKIRAIHRQFRDKLQSVQRLLNSVDYRSDWEDAFKGDVARIAEARAQHWTTTLDIEIDNLSKKHNRKRTGQQVNNDVALVASKLAIEGSTKHFAKDSILPTYLKSTTQYCKSAENDAIVHCNHLLADIQLPDVQRQLLFLPNDNYQLT